MGDVTNKGWRRTEIIILVGSLTACTVTVRPIGHEKYHRQPIVHHHPKQSQKVIGQGPKQGTTIVTSEWIREYDDLAYRYGHIAEDQQIKVSDGGFIIPEKVNARYQLLKKTKIDSESQPR
jgi:hypothetical protein